MSDTVDVDRVGGVSPGLDASGDVDGVGGGVYLNFFSVLVAVWYSSQ